MGDLDPLQSDDHERIKDIYASSAASLAAGNIETLSRYYTEDAVQLPPNAAPIAGWGQIYASLESELAGVNFNTSMDIEEIIVVGDCAVARGKFRNRVFPGAGGRPSLASGSFLDVLFRQTDRSWKIARSAWSSHELGEDL